MKKILLIFILILSACTIQATTLQELIDKFRIRTAETDTTESVISNLSLTVMLNLSLQKIVPMAGYIERTQKYAFSRDSSYYVLPSNFKRAKNLMLLSDSKWYAILPNVTQTEKSPVSKYSIAWINPDSAELRITLGEVVSTHTDLVYNEDSAYYTLPPDYMKYVYATHFSNSTYRWHAIYENIGFQKDTTVKNGYVFEKTPDTALYYYKDNYALEGDTIRIVYIRTMKAGDTIEVEYYAESTPLVDLTDTLDVPLNLEPYIIEEAIIYYHEALKNYVTAKSDWEKLRMDMGILKPQSQGK